MRISRKGFTLVEIVISTAILCVATLAIGGLMVHGLRGWSLGTGRDSANNQATIAMQKLCNDVRSARTAAVSSSGDRLTVTFPQLLTDSNTSEQAYDSSVNSATTCSYYVANGDLMKQSGGVVRTFVPGVSSITFSWSDDTNESADRLAMVAVTLKGKKQVGDSISYQEISGYISLRNYK
jgi:prepilin-type N-terminal cleavage/methylation domain-containing protein